MEDLSFKSPYSKKMYKLISICLAIFGLIYLTNKGRKIIDFIFEIASDGNFFMGNTFFLSGIILFIVLSVNYKEYKKDFITTIVLIIVYSGIFLLFSDKLLDGLKDIPRMNDYFSYEEQLHKKFTNSFEYALANLKLIFSAAFFSMVMAAVLNITWLFLVSVYGDFKEKIGSTKDSLTIVISIIAIIISVISLSK